MLTTLKKKKVVSKPLLFTGEKTVSSAEFRHLAKNVAINIYFSSQHDKENAPVRTVTRSKDSGL
jgi:hypothetical protein